MAGQTEHSKLETVLPPQAFYLGRPLNPLQPTKEECRQHLFTQHGPVLAYFELRSKYRNVLRPWHAIDAAAPPQLFHRS